MQHSSESEVQLVLQQSAQKFVGRSLDQRKLGARESLQEPVDASLKERRGKRCLSRRRDLITVSTAMSFFGPVIRASGW